MRAFQRRLARLFAVAGMAVIGIQSSHAQSAQITGRVTDPSGAVVSRALIDVSQVETGVRKTSVTNDSGIYVQLALRAEIAVRPGRTALGDIWRVWRA